MCLKESDMKQQKATQPQRNQKEKWETMGFTHANLPLQKTQSNVQNAVCYGESHKMEYLTRTVLQRQKKLNPSFQFSKHNHDTRWSRWQITPLSNKEHQVHITPYRRWKSRDACYLHCQSFYSCVKDHDQNPHGAEKLYFFSQLRGYPSALTLAERLSAMDGVCP